MIPLFKRQRAASILGLALDGNRLEVVSLRRSNGTLNLRQTLAVSLALNPLTDAAELVGWKSAITWTRRESANGVARSVSR